MTIKEVVAKSRVLYLRDPTRQINWSTSGLPDYVPFTYTDAADEIVAILKDDELESVILDLLRNYSEVKLNPYYTGCVGSTAEDGTCTEVVKTLISAFVSQQLGMDECVCAEIARREKQEEAVVSQKLYVVR